MAHVTFIDPIDTLSGKIARRHKTTYMLRTAPTSNEKMLEKPVFTMARRKRNKPLTAAEISARERFGSISHATRERMMDPSFIAQDQVAFRNQTQHKTFYKYIWHLCTNQYDNAK